MVVQHNMTAMNSNRQLGITTAAQAKTTEKLSSGYKINRAADDAAGLTISEKMRSQIRGLTQASSNAQDGVSMVQTAEGALAEVHDMLQRMNELAIKASNGSQTSGDRVAINKELTALVSEIDRVAQSTEFNTKNLLDGHLDVNMQVGAKDKAEQRIKVKITAMNASGLNLSNIRQNNSIRDASGAKAQAIISTITKAISKVSSMRSTLGAIQNRLEHTITNLDNIVENTTAAESSIRDTDMATTMVAYSKNNILSQAGQSMLAQANQSNQGVLSLLG